MVGPPGRWSAPSVTEPEETAVDVASWLRDLGLERYEAAFRENDVNAELLPNLTADDLKELGVTSRRPSAPVCWKRSPRCASEARRLMALFGCRPA